MRHPLLIALIGLMLLPVPVSAQSNTGRKLDAIQSGRHYDRLLSPSMNPNYQFQPNAEAMFLNDLRQGRVDVDKILAAQRQYFQMQLNSTR